MNKNQKWYASALEVLGPLRYHLNEVIETVESHNQFALKLNQIPVPSRQIEEAKKALEIAEKFFCGNVP